MAKAIIAYLASRNPNNKEVIRVYDFGLNSEQQTVNLTFLYRHHEYTKPVETLITNQYDIPTHTGERYIVINNLVYFIDDIKDVNGVWNY